MEKIIKIVKDGPYIVRGDIPIVEKVIAHDHGEYVSKDAIVGPRTRGRSSWKGPPST